MIYHTALMAPPKPACGMSEAPLTAVRLCCTNLLHSSWHCHHRHSWQWHDSPFKSHILIRLYLSHLLDLTPTQLPLSGPGRRQMPLPPTPTHRWTGGCQRIHCRLYWWLTLARKVCHSLFTPVSWVAAC